MCSSDYFRVSVGPTPFVVFSMNSYVVFVAGFRVFVMCSHDYEDSISVVDGCAFVQVCGVVRDIVSEV